MRAMTLQEGGKPVHGVELAAIPGGETCSLMIDVFVDNIASKLQ
ncbi:MAG: hypothetical protein AAF982_11455 [Pseudomonadota bacterium]